MTESKNNLYALKVLLIIQTIGLIAYTIVAIQNDGANFIGRAQEFVRSMTWMGQFALDFNCYLMLSALWIMWRNKFTISSILIGLIALILGIIVFAPYLLYLLIKEKGDLKTILLGARA